MATDNEFLRLIYLALANSSVGTSGAGMTAVVRDGVDASADIDQIKSVLQQLVGASTPQASQFLTIRNTNFDPYCIENAIFSVTFEVPSGFAWKPLALKAGMGTSSAVDNQFE